MAQVIYFLLWGILNLITFGLQKDNIFLLAMMCPVNIVYGLYYAKESTNEYQWIIGVAIAILGTYSLFKAVGIGVSNIRKKRTTT